MEEAEKERIDKIIEIKSRILNAGFFHVNPEINFYPYTHIYVDLDSYVSILLHPDLEINKYTSKRILSIMLENISDFIKLYYNDAYIIFYHNFSTYSTFQEYYPKWKSIRNKRLHNKEVLKIIQDVISRISIFSQRIGNVECIHSYEDNIISIGKALQAVDKNDKVNAIVISRDPHYIPLLSRFDFSIYDGKEILHRKNYYKYDGFPKIPYTFLPYYYTLVGMKRNDYPGYKLFGPKKAYKYIVENKLSILENKDPILKDSKLKNIFTFQDII